MVHPLSIITAQASLGRQVVTHCGSPLLLLPNRTHAVQRLLVRNTVVIHGSAGPCGGHPALAKAVDFAEGTPLQGGEDRNRPRESSWYASTISSCTRAKTGYVGLAIG